MATAFDYLVNFWRTIDENGSMTWKISDNHMSVLYYLNDDILNYYASSFGLVGSCPLRCRFSIRKCGNEIILRELNL